MSLPDKYEKDENGKEIYPLVKNLQTVILNRYARDKDQIPFYPRDVDRNEFMDPNLGLIERHGEYIYPKNIVDGKPRYRTDPNNPKRQIYEKIDGREYIGRGLDGHQYYATDENNDEYYPEKNIPAQKANGTLRYARKANGAIIYPKDDNDNEYYLTFVDPCDNFTIYDRYAHEKNGNEIYPQVKLDDDLISDHILHNTYIKRDGLEWYPRDAYNNEFYKNIINNDPEDVILDRYALTNDGKIIVPGHNNTYYISTKRQPKITDDDILGSLVRGKKGVSPDFLTRIEVSNKPNVQPKKYKYLDNLTNIYKTITPPGIKKPSVVVPFYQTWYFWVLIILSSILKSIAVWWLFFRHEVKAS